MPHHDTNHPTDKTTDRRVRGQRDGRRHGSSHGHRPLDADTTELELIQHLARRLRRGSAVETAPWGLSPHQARALAVIARGEFRRRRHGRDTDHGGPTSTDAGDQPRGMRLGELARWLQVAARSATDVVDSLEERELVERTPDPDDRRAVRVSLTERGRTVSREIRAARKAQTETLLDALNEQERAHLRQTLLTLLEAADG